jgi:hypothetical protein
VRLSPRRKIDCEPNHPTDGNTATLVWPNAAHLLDGIRAPLMPAEKWDRDLPVGRIPECWHSSP